MDTTIQRARRQHAVGNITDEELAAVEVRCYGPLVGEDLECWYYELHRDAYGYKPQDLQFLHAMDPVEVQVLLNQMQAHLEEDMRREAEALAEEWAPARDERTFAEWFADRTGLSEESSEDYLDW